MKITSSWLNEHRTRNGSYTKAQLLLIGMPSPPTHGWLKNKIGDEISEEDRLEFERIAKENKEVPILNPNLFEVDSE